MFFGVNKMVLPLAPGKFYGGSLPRPWIYGDVKFNSERIDPPSPPSAPLLSWANEAHWSMGGLCSKRKRMQGKIEGSIKKLRAIEEEEDEAEDLAVSGGSEASKLRPAHATVADEGIERSGVVTNETPSKKGSPGFRTRAKKSSKRGPSDKVQKSDQNSSGFAEASSDVKAVEEDAGFRVSPRNKKRKGESEDQGVEPETSKCDKSVRRSGRISSPALVSSRVSTRSSGSRSVAAM